MIVYGNEKPNEVVWESGKTLINVDAIEVTNENGSSWKYEQVELPFVATEEDALARMAKIRTDRAKTEALSYLASTDWITSKYNDVVTVLGTMSKADFVAKYKDVYDNRIAARAVVGGE